MPAPQIISVSQGEDYSFTVEIYPQTPITGWSLQWVAKSNQVNPPAADTILADDLDASATTLTVDQKIAPFPQRPPFKIRIDNEIFWVSVAYGYYTNGSYNFEWTVERGMHGTTATTHLKGARVELFTTPMMLLDNGSLGGVSVEDEDTGVIRVTLGASFTFERPTGTWFWVLRRNDSGYNTPIAQGTLYLIPSAMTALQEPPV